MSDVSFRPVHQDDLAMLEQLIASPHWQAWWGDPAEEIGHIRAMVEGRDSTRPFIFRIDGEDAGYIQYWIIADQLHEPWLSEAPWMPLMPEGAIGVDISIADPQSLSKGVGSAVLRAFVTERVIEGYRNIIIDPDRENRRAVRAYEKAGFVPVPQLRGRTGDTLIMQFDTGKVLASQ